MDEEELLLRRKSWVMAMPMEAKASEVRSQARKVRSRARWSRATEPRFSSSRERRGLYQGFFAVVEEVEVVDAVVEGVVEEVGDGGCGGGVEEVLW